MIDRRAADPALATSPAGPTRRGLLAGAAALVAVGRSGAVPPLPPARSGAPAEPPPPVARLDETLEVAGDPLAARLLRTRLTVPVLVDGRGPFRFAVDSGADRSVIGRALATALGLAAGPPVMVHSTTGTAPAPTVRVPTLRLGDATARDLLLPALAEADLGVQGLLGIDALAGRRLLLDFDGHRIVVQDPARARLPADPDEVVVVARRRGGQLILTEAAAAGVPIWAVIDSGAEATVGNLALRDRLFRRPPRAPERVELLGVLGTRVVADSLLLPDLSVGRVRLGGVPVAFFDAPPFALFGLAERPALLLGTDVLRAFSRVALDFRAKRVRFRLRRG